MESGYRGITKEEQQELEDISKQVRSELHLLESERRKVMRRAFWSRIVNLLKRKK